MDSLDDPDDWDEAFCIDIRDVAATATELQIARTEVDEIVDIITWRVNDDMRKRLDWLGITRLVPHVDGQPYEVVDQLELQDATDEAELRGLTRRPLVLAIMREYVDALKKYKPDTEPHIRARFQAGHTVAHEFGHAVWAHDFREGRYIENCSEPFVANHRTAELGAAFISWIFGGFCPHFVEISDRMFEKNLVWVYDLQPGLGHDAALDGTQFTLGLQFMEDILNQSVWDRIAGPIKTVAWSTAVQARFTPDVLADSAASNWRVAGAHGESRGLSLGDLNLTAEEIEMMRDKTSSEKEDEDDEENFMIKEEPTDEIEDLDLQDMATAGDVNDGIVRQNKRPAAGQQTVLTRVIVYYNPMPGLLDDKGAFVKRTGAHQNKVKRRSYPNEDDDDDEDDNDDDERGFNHRKRMRGDDSRDGAFSGYKKQPTKAVDPEDLEEIAARKKDEELRFGKEDYDCRDVQEVLQNISVRAVEGFTMFNAWLYCNKHDIQFPYEMEPEVAFQDQQLNRQDHLELISAIRMFRFVWAYESFGFDGDKKALILINKERIRSISEYSDEAVQSLLDGHGLPSLPRPDLNRQTLKDHYNIQIGALQTREEKAADKYRPDFGQQDPTRWDDESVLDFLKTNKLPLWGDRLTQIARINQYLLELDNPNGVSRKKTNLTPDNMVIGRTDANGRERYVFDVVLDTTLVSTLKGEVFKKGMFPANSTLNMRFSKGMSDFADAAFLSRYNDIGGRDWNNVIVELLLPDAADPPPMEASNAIYQPRGMDFGAGRGPRANGSGFVINITGDNTVFDLTGSVSGAASGSGATSNRGIMTATGAGGRKKKAVPFKAPDYLLRQAAIIAAPDTRTVAELMESIAHDQAQMSGAVRAGAGHDSSLRANHTADLAGGEEMLDNLIDLTEQEDDRVAMVVQETMDPGDRPVMPVQREVRARDGKRGISVVGRKSGMREIYERFSPK